MKKLVFVFVVLVFAVNNLCAQEAETLTNSTIIMMAKAKLSDDLIIDEIKNSKTNFNLSADSLKLLYESVSYPVVQAMKIAGGVQTTDVPKDTVKKSSTIVTQPEISNKENITQQQQPVQNKDSLAQAIKKQQEIKREQEKELLKEKNKTVSTKKELIEKTTLTMNATGYTIPVEDLMQFFDKEFTTLAGVIQGWDKRIRDSANKVSQIKEKIQQYEKELAEKKNADANGYSNVILVLNKDLAAFRVMYKQAMANMLTDGLAIVKECKNSGSEMDERISNKFSNVSSSVKKTNPDPVKGGITKAISITKQKFNGEVVDQVASATQMLYFCQNEITSLQGIVLIWNEKVLAINQKDSVLRKQLEPLNQQLENLKSDPKKNKQEISELKKQYSKIEKERSQLENQMADESKEFSEYLKKLCVEVQSAAKTRFTDIVETINFSYQDKFIIDK